MNIPNLLRTRNYLASHPDDYFQAEWTHGCGTPACVAGYAVVACGGRLVPNSHMCVTAFGVYKELSSHATKLLGLTVRQKVAMFMATPYGTSRNPLKPVRPVSVWEALRMLDYAIEHGVVRWPPRGTEDPRP